MESQLYPTLVLSRCFPFTLHGEMLYLKSIERACSWNSIMTHVIVNILKIGIKDNNKLESILENDIIISNF